MTKRWSSTKSRDGLTKRAASKKARRHDEFYGERCPYRNPDCPLCYPENSTAITQAEK